MTNYGGLTYGFSTIQQACSDIDNFVNYMNTELDDIERKLRPLETDWTSEAQTEYLRCKNKWNSNAREIASTLLKLKLALSGAGNRMQEADARAAKLFPGS